MSSPDENVVIVIDGSNLFHAARERFPTQQALLDVCRSYAATHGMTLWMFFDGNGPFDAVGERSLGKKNRCIATGTRDADSRISAAVREASKAGLTVWLVTSDVALKETNSNHTQLQLDASTFAARLQNEDNPYNFQETNSDLQIPLPGDNIQSRISEKERELLERIRRQQG